MGLNELGSGHLTARGFGVYLYEPQTQSQKSSIEPGEKTSTSLELQDGGRL